MKKSQAKKSSELAGKPLPYNLEVWLNEHFDVPSLAVLTLI
jgi:hypothetical protein